MADEILKRDQNSSTVSAGIGSDASQDILMLRVDPDTKYLLVDSSSTGASSGSAGTIAERDQNGRTVYLAWDETNEVLQEVITDSSGRLLVNIASI